MATREILIAVIGGHDKNDKVERLAHKIGKITARVGGILVCGGLGGAMKAACEGAKTEGGQTIGLLPGTDKKDANPFVDIAIPTSIGFARNTIVACCADLIIALPGSHGTNTEICYGLVYGRPVLDLGGWKIPGMIPAKNLGQAERLIQDYVGKIRAAQP